MKIYGVYESTNIDIESGIHPIPRTLIRAFDSESKAISFMESYIHSNNNPQKIRDWCYEWKDYGQKYYNKVFICEIEVN